MRPPHKLPPSYIRGGWPDQTRPLERLIVDRADASVVGADPRLLKIAQRVNEQCDWGDWGLQPWDAYDLREQRSRVEQVRSILEAAEEVDGGCG